MATEKEVTVKPEPDQPMTPGFGVSGMVMCPFFKGACLKGACELWVELKCGDRFVARCSIAWLTVLSVETRQSIDKLVPILQPNKKR